LVVVAVVNCCRDRALGQRVAYTVELLGKRELLPLEQFVHVAVYVYVMECTVEKKFDCLEIVAYVRAFCAWSDAMHVMSGYLQCAFVITAQRGGPPSNLIELRQCLCQKMQCAQAEEFCSV
jgi:hypothetical protein